MNTAIKTKLNLAKAAKRKLEIATKAYNANRITADQYAAAKEAYHGPFAAAAAALDALFHDDHVVRWVMLGRP